MASVESAPFHRVRDEIDLPTPSAVWVLTAHVLTILSPLLLVWFVVDRWSGLTGLLERPALLVASATAFVVGSVCESAQNTLDRWYLTGAPPSLLDLCFNTLVMAGMAFQVLAVYGDTGWMWPVTWAVVALFPVAYLRGWPTPPLQAVLGIAAAGAVFAATRDPVIWLSLLTVFCTLFFFNILRLTLQQVMHGFTTLVNAVAVVITVAALNGGLTDARWQWWQAIAVAVVVVGGLLLLRPVLLRLPATPHRVTRAAGGAPAAAPISA